MNHTLYFVGEGSFLNNPEMSLFSISMFGLNFYAVREIQSGLMVLAKNSPTTCFAPLSISLFAVLVKVVPRVITSSIKMTFLSMMSFFSIRKLSSGLLFLPPRCPGTSSCNVWIDEMLHGIPVSFCKYSDSDLYLFIVVIRCDAGMKQMRQSVSLEHSRIKPILSTSSRFTDKLQIPSLKS